MISSVVTHGSQCKVAPAALLELKAATDLFELAASYGGRAVKFLVSVFSHLQVYAKLSTANRTAAAGQGAEGLF